MANPEIKIQLDKKNKPALPNSGKAVPHLAYDTFPKFEVPLWRRDLTKSKPKG
jgi:hypothetical protein